MNKTECACGLDYEAEYRKLKNALAESKAKNHILLQEIEKLKRDNSYFRGKVEVIELIFGGKKC